MSLLLLFFGGSGSGVTPSPTPAATTSSEDTHSWFEVQPVLLPAGRLQAPLRGRMTVTLPRMGWTFAGTVTVTPPTVVSVPLPVPVPTKTRGVLRVSIPALHWTWQGTMDQPEEELILAFAALYEAPKPRTTLVSRRAIEDRWLAVVADLLRAP